MGPAMDLHISDRGILFEEPFLTVSYAPKQQLIHLEWRGYAKSEEYRKGLDLAVDFAVENGVRCWLADLREMGPILQKDEKWANEVWFPKLFKGSLEKMAVLRAADYFNQTSVERSFKVVSGSVTFHVAYFPTEEEALVWLFERVAMVA